MLTRMVRIQVVVFTIVALIGVTFVGARYIGAFDWLIGGGYTVKAQFADSGGVFVNSEVTYRGVAIGKVTSLRLIDGGVEVDLTMDGGSPPVPADVEATVTNRSAVGEQYIDLKPRNNKAPYLADGTVIPKKSSSLPLPVESVVLNLNNLAESVPKDDLRTVVDEIYDATQGSGPDLQALLDSSSSFVKKANDNLPQTLALITDAKTVLTTQMQQSGTIRQFAANMDMIAQQLKQSDGDIRSLLTTVPGVSQQVTEILQESGANLGTLVGNLATTSDILFARRNGLEQLLVVTPQVIDAGNKVIKADGARFGLITSYFDPLPCVYSTTKYRNGTDTSGIALNEGARCTNPSPGTGVRGSQNAPGGR